MVTEKEKLRTQAMFLLGGTYIGEAKKHVFEKIQNALEQGIIHLEELGITKEQWSDLEKGFIEVDVSLPVEKMTPNEAKDLAKTFSALWQEIQKVKDEEQKKELLDLLRKLWPRINRAISTRLITNSDLGLKRTTEYFEISALVHEGEKSKK